MNSEPQRAGAGAGAPARVLIVEDHPIVRRGLCEVIGGEPDLAVCGEAADADAALDALERCHPDAMVVDILLPGRNGIDLLKDVKARRPRLPVLVLSMYDEALYAERALRAGARGYVMKEEATDKVLAALRRIIGGHVYLSDRLSSEMVRRVLEGATAAGDSPLEQLSDRELEVFHLIREGLPMREIADRLRRSIKTVETHREHIKTKLGLRTSGELIRYAVEHGPDLERARAAGTPEPAAPDAPAELSPEAPSPEAPSPEAPETTPPPGG